MAGTSTAEPTWGEVVAMQDYFGKTGRKVGNCSCCDSFIDLTDGSWSSFRSKKTWYIHAVCGNGSCRNCYTTPAGMDPRTMRQPGRCRYGYSILFDRELLRGMAIPRGGDYDLSLSKVAVRQSKAREKASAPLKWRGWYSKWSLVTVPLGFALFGVLAAENTHFHMPVWARAVAGVAVALLGGRRLRGRAWTVLVFYAIACVVMYQYVAGHH